MDRQPTKTSALRFLLSAGLDFGTIVDVGAMTKTAELIEVFPHRRHILFEPNEKHHAALARNYAKIDHAIVPWAVSDQPGSTLDDYFASHHHEPWPYLLKIDVDGGELAVLRGSPITLGRSSIVIMEVYTHTWIERQSALYDAGFVLVDVVDPRYYKGKFAQADIIMGRKEIVRGTPALVPTKHGEWDWREWRGPG